MTSCPACATAEEREPTRGGLIYANCKSCSARSLANSPMALKAMAGAPEELQAVIERIWGAENYAEGRAAVWRWMERIKAWKAQQQ